MPPREKNAAAPSELLLLHDVISQGKCPRCGGTELRLLEYHGKSYPQCVGCHFWSTSTKLDGTWGRHGG